MSNLFKPSQVVPVHVGFLTEVAGGLNRSGELELAATLDGIIQHHKALELTISRIIASRSQFPTYESQDAMDHPELFA